MSTEPVQYQKLFYIARKEDPAVLPDHVLGRHIIKSFVMQRQLYLCTVLAFNQYTQKKNAPKIVFTVFGMYCIYVKTIEYTLQLRIYLR